MNRLETRIAYLFVGIGVGALFVIFSGGCSTVSGVADLVSGISSDIKDMAEGTRDRMGSNSNHR